MKKKLIVSLLAVSAWAFGFLVVPTVNAESKAEGKIPGQYIVVFRDNIEVESVTKELVKNQGLGHLFTYAHALKGFAATIPDAKLAKIKNDPRVAAVVEDRIVTANVKPAPVVAPITSPTQKVPNGIKRIGAEGLANNGLGVTVAVIDTGIDLTHLDLATNILGKGKSCVPRVASAKDDNGHGTHVAGTIAAADNSIGAIGVAPQAKLVPVKVLDKTGSGSTSSVICGIDWVTANASTLKIKVANMSLGGGGLSDNNCGYTNGDLMHQAICKSRDAGVTYVVAAGNEGVDASNSVPAAYDDAVITVSALVDTDGKFGGYGGLTSYGTDDTFASFSNYGTVVDLGAPGVNIYSTWKGGAYNTISGTSMATPHVSGAAALYLSAYPESSWTTVRDELRLLGEKIGDGHTDPTGKYLDPVVNVLGF
jgi:subtilisin family serine protease